MLEKLENWLLEFGPELSGSDASSSFDISAAIAILGTLVLSVISAYLAKHFLVPALSYFIAKFNTKWKDTALRQKLLQRLTYLAPALVLYLLLPLSLQGYELLGKLIKSGLVIYIVIVLMLVIDAFLNTVEDIYKSRKKANRVPIKSFIQAIKIVVYFITIIFVISILLNKTPVYLLSGIGALAAVMMLVFRDSLLGFVAGIQLAANKMVAVGDWIEMPKYGADGDVLEVALTTVKVQNWDKTITTIPTYALISESFKNWRGMAESDGRRIKRALHIDMNSIKFCDEKMLSRFEKIQYIAEYIEEKKKQLQTFNQSTNVDHSSLANGRRLTNVGTFRAYIEAYLSHHPMINKEMTFLVRQLTSTQHGLPIEVYVFSKDKAWENYESIQADIFDHLLAVLTEFDLRIYQNPTGADFRHLAL